MAKTFTLTSVDYDGRYLQLYCEQTPDIANNRSTIKWTLSSLGGESTYYQVGPTTVTIAGTDVYYCKKMTWDTRTFPAAKGSVSGSHIVTHDNSGNSTIAVSLSTSIYTGVIKTANGNWTLDSIPRWATITAANNFTDVDNPSISFTNLGGFPIDVWLEPNPPGDHLCVKTGIASTGSYTWTLSATERDALRSRCSRSSCPIRLGIYTYIGGVQYADYKDVTYTMTENTATKPDVRLSVSPNNGSLPSDVSGMYIQGYTRVNVSISATGKYGATINSYSTNVDGKTYLSGSFTSDALKSSGSVTIYGTAKDSREFGNTASAQINVVEYSKPAVTAIAYRCTETGNENPEGDYIRVGFTATIASLGGKNSASYVIDYGGTPIEGAGTSYLSEPIAWDVSRVCTVEVKVSDKIDTTTKPAVIPIAFTLMDFYNTGKGVALGKVATRDGFDCAMETYFGGKRLQEVGAPIADTDAVNKGYAEANFSPSVVVADASVYGWDKLDQSIQSFFTNYCIVRGNGLYSFLVGCELPGVDSLGVASVTVFLHEDPEGDKEALFTMKFVTGTFAGYSLQKCARSIGYGWEYGTWEWDNPPMAEGVEYRTTERFMGKPVYCVALTGTSSQGQNYAALPTVIAAGELVSVTGHVGDYPVPTQTSSYVLCYDNWVHSSVGFICDSIYAGLKYRFIVKYTKA